MTLECFPKGSEKATGWRWSSWRKVPAWPWRSCGWRIVLCDGKGQPECDADKYRGAFRKACAKEGKEAISCRAFASHAIFWSWKGTLTQMDWCTNWWINGALPHRLGLERFDTKNISLKTTRFTWVIVLWPSRKRRNMVAKLYGSVCRRRMGMGYETGLIKTKTTTTNKHDSIWKNSGGSPNHDMFFAKQIHLHTIEWCFYVKSWSHWEMMLFQVNGLLYCCVYFPWTWSLGKKPCWMRWVWPNLSGQNNVRLTDLVMKCCCDI